MDEKVLFQIKPEVFTVDELRRLRRLYKPMGKLEEVRLRACPACKELMYRKNWGGHSGVVVDRCEQHGTWYDEGEAEKIREYVRLGGVEFEKLYLTEQGLSDLQSKLNNEVTRLDIRIDSAYRRARLWSLLSF
jgi:Zn-finger nucleic acid-binding protein